MRSSDWYCYPGMRSSDWYCSPDLGEQHLGAGGGASRGWHVVWSLREGDEVWRVDVEHHFAESSFSSICAGFLEFLPEHGGSYTFVIE